MPEIQIYPVTESERLKKYIHETPDLVLLVTRQMFNITVHKALVATMLIVLFAGCAEDSHNVRRYPCAQSGCALACERLTSSQRRLDEALAHGGDISTAQVALDEARNDYAECRGHLLGY